MSLFKLRDAWSTRFPDEEFETRGLCVGDVLNESIGKDIQQQIAVGSFQGTVRLFRPLQRGSHSEDLLLEHNVGAPILQVAIAPTHTAGHNVLVVLCPRKLIYLKVTKSAVAGTAEPSKRDTDNKPEDQAGNNNNNSNDDDDDDHHRHEEAMSSLASNTMFQVEAVADLVLQRTSHSFLTGLFGKPPSNLHGVVVQSMDGNLDFYSGPHASFNRFLPSSSFLLPSAMHYVESIDTFFFGTSTFAVESYAFTTLAGANAADTRDESRQGRKLQPDWSFVIGEDILSIKECRLLLSSAKELKSNSATEIAVLAEHSLVLLSSDKGTPMFNIRLDYAPMCMAVFPKPNGKHNNNISDQQQQHQLLLCSSTGSFFIHCGNNIEWSAKMEGTSSAPPIAVEVAQAQFCKTQGMIVVLSDDGVLSVNYLGTDPATQQSVQVLQREEMDVEAAIRENAEIQQAILIVENGGVPPPISSGAGGGKSTAAAPPPPPTEPEPAETWEPLEISCDTPVLDHNGGLVSTSFYLFYSGSQDLVNVVLSFSGSLPIASNCHTHKLAVLPARSRVSVPVSFGINQELNCMMPSSLMVDVVASYSPTSSSSASSGAVDDVVSRMNIALPLGLVCRPLPKVKNAPFKLQIDITNRTTVPQVDELFDDIAVFNPELVETHSMSIQFCNGVDGTVLLSKNGSRYRITSSSFAGLWLLTSELLRRLRKLLNTSTGPAGDDADVVSFEFPDDVPLGDLYDVIDTHFNARLQLSDASKKVTALSEQLRAVQRRLIARFREQNPAPMKSMQQLFEVTYRSLREGCGFMEHSMVGLKAASSCLACAIHLILLVSKYRLQLDRDEFELLRNFLSPAVEDSVMNEVGWEETTVAGLTHLLRTSLSKNKVDPGAVVAQPLSIQTDTSKVKNNIQLVFQRLMKGSKMSGGGAVD